MKRRDFLCSAGAAAAIPVLPLPASAAPAAATPVSASQVGWASLYARAQAKASPALIQKWLGVGPDQASALMSELSRLNVLQAPLGGTALAADPMYARHGVPGGRPVGPDMIKRASNLVRDLIEDKDAIETDFVMAEPEEAENETS